jgi:hypothetical protein
MPSEISSKSSRVLAFATKHWFLTLAVSLLVVVLGWKSIWAFVTDPRVNPNPRQKIVIEGTFPFSAGVELRLVAGFSVENPACVSNDRLFGVIGTGGKNYKRFGYVLPIEKLPNDRYRTEFYVDHLQPGFCDWSYGSLTEDSYDPTLGPPRQRIQPLMSGFPLRVQRETMYCTHTTSKLPHLKGRRGFGCGPQFMDFPNSHTPSPYNPLISEYPGAAQLDFSMAHSPEPKGANDVGYRGNPTAAAR